MNADVLKANWKQLKGAVKKQWGKLTDDEILQMKGTSEELSGVLQKKYGYEKERVKKEIESFMSNQNLEKGKEKNRT